MKGKRQQEILNIVASQELETQEQLLEQLRQRGINTTQATISRDIKQLHLVKELTAGGIYKYAASPQKVALNFAGRLRTIFRQGVTSTQTAQNMIVVKTMPGLANGVASAVDHMEVDGLVGTLAGDDTVLLIMRDNASAEAFCEEIKGMML